MADITMCSGTGCPNKERCIRFTSEPNRYRQSWFSAVPYNDDEKRCEHLMRPYMYTKGVGDSD